MRRPQCSGWILTPVRGRVGSQRGPDPKRVGATGDVNGDELVALRYAGGSALEATVTFTTHTDASFDLTLTCGTGTKKYEFVQTERSHAKYVVDVINDAFAPNWEWTAVDLRDPDFPGRVPHGTAAVQEQFHAFTVHTGMVTYPLAQFARIVTDAGLTRLAPKAEAYAAAAREAVAFHAPEVQFYEDHPDSADYAHPVGAALRHDGLIQPYNQSHALGATQVELYRLDGDQAYARTVKALVASFLRGADLVDNAYVWSYWPPSSQAYAGYQGGTESTYTPRWNAAPGIEDISHAAITVEFLVAASRAGIGLTATQLASLKRTFSQNMVTGGDTVAYRVDGSDPRNTVSLVGQLPRWLPLAAWLPDAPGQALSTWNAAGVSGETGSYVAGRGYLVWAHNAGCEGDNR
ncbi:hypothetical protein [Parenemella sanctibonifatiensis]|uniref:hypothetical protein n=1 Tax=Parenemella sanctibonifatiensis TaxID=2016505 RepID=UPI0011867590|nr:hypothetical protein [Parenemella sanctibonifatiensis]